jgi:hypothetical protein
MQRLVRQSVVDETALTTDVEKYFSYELTSMPSALFKDGFLRKGVKSQLAHELHSKVDTSVTVP